MLQMNHSSIGISASRREESFWATPGFLSFHALRDSDCGAFRPGDLSAADKRWNGMNKAGSSIHEA